MFVLSRAANHMNIKMQNKYFHRGWLFLLEIFEAPQTNNVKKKAACLPASSYTRTCAFNADTSQTRDLNASDCGLVANALLNIVVA